MSTKSSKKMMSKKQNNMGTFKVENPKKMKKVGKDKQIKKKNNLPLTSEKKANKAPINDKKKVKVVKNVLATSEIKGMDFNLKGQKKKRGLVKEDEAATETVNAHLKRKVTQSDSDHEGVTSSKQVKLTAKKKKRPFEVEKHEDTSSPKKAKFDSGKLPKFNPKLKNGFGGHSAKKTSNNSDNVEKPNWNKLKEEKKALREKRRAAQKNADSYEVSIEAKKILESIRSRKCPAAEQIKQLDRLYSLLQGKLLSVVYAHDMSRVVETMLKFAHTHKKSVILSKMFEELLPEMLEMSKRKYATHVVRALIAHLLPAQRAQLVKVFRGHVLKLLSHKVGSVVLEHLYVKCKPEEQCELQRELYGGSQKLISSESVTGLGIIFKNLPNMKESTLANTKEILMGLFEKNVVHSHIIHSVLLDYLGFASPAESSEMLAQARNHVKAFTQSKEGVHVAMMCLWTGTPKDRKKIVKEIKEGVVNLANGEYSHMLLLAIFDTVDDTVFIQKAILAELLAGDLLPLLSNTYGRKVLMYLCSRRDPKMFTAPVIATLSAGDNNPHSKKESSVRALELQKFTVPFLLEHIAQNTNIWMENNSNLLVLLAAVKVGCGDKLSIALKAISKHVANPQTSENEKGIDLRIADNTGCHMFLKKLAQHDKVFIESGLATFGEALLSELTENHYEAWLCNNHCCFLLLEILKNSSEEVSSNLRTKIKSISKKVWKKSELVPLGGKKIQEIL